MTDVIEVFSEVLTVVKSIKDIQKDVQKTGDKNLTKKFEDQTLKLSQELCETITEILSHHVEQGEKKLTEIQEMLNLDHVKNLIKTHTS